MIGCLMRVNTLAVSTSHGVNMPGTYGYFPQFNGDHGMPAITERKPFSWSPIDLGPQTEEDTFWRSIISDPFDYAPRAVFSDWLEEREDERFASMRAWGPGGHDKLETANTITRNLRLRYCWGEWPNVTVLICITQQLVNCIREGFFLLYPIQRVVLLDLYDRFDSTVTLRMDIQGRDEPEFHVQNDGSLLNELIVGQTNKTWKKVIITGFEYMLSRVSLGCVEFGRVSSGLPRIGWIEEPERDALGKLWLKNAG